MLYFTEHIIYVSLLPLLLFFPLLSSCLLPSVHPPTPAPLYSGLEQKDEVVSQQGFPFFNAAINLCVKAVKYNDPVKLKVLK